MKHDGSNIVRGNAVRALGAIGDDRAVELLTQAQYDNDRYIQSIAKEVLKSIKSKTK
jgi:HEAT repeat protein